MNEAMSGIITIATAVIGVAILAVLVSKNANTAAVIGAGGNAFSNILQSAVSPVTSQMPQQIQSYVA